MTNPTAADIANKEPTTPTVTTPDPTSTPPEGQQLVEKDGKMFLGDREVVWAADLIGAKKGLETRLSQSETAHTEAMDRATKNLSESQKEVAVLTVENRTLKETGTKQAGETGAVTPTTEVTPVTTPTTPAPEATAVIPADTEAATKLLARTKEVLQLSHGLKPEQLEGKTQLELDALETAAKALATARGGASGVGNYALGGGVGGSEPMTQMERARAVVENPNFKR